MLRVRKGLVVGLTTMTLWGLGGSAADASVLAFDALREPLRGTKQRFELVWQDAGMFVLFSADDGNDGDRVFWGPSGSQNFNWVYPCVDRDVTRWPGVIAESDGDVVLDPFVQKRTTANPPSSEMDLGGPNIPTC
jgi:hypothetical protein